MRSTVASIALSISAACIPSHGPLMSAGQDCLGCHDGAAAKRWTAAGTWAGARQVTISDANGRSMSFRPNRAGNFYTAERLAFPLAVSVDGTPMPKPVTYGGCNACHANGTIITGPNMAPGADCLKCHDGGMAPAFTLAGTWPPQGGTVSVADATGKTVTLTTNQVGNFYTSDPLSFPLTVSVNGQTMPEPVTYGGCNACHGGGGGGG